MALPELRLERSVQPVQPPSLQEMQARHESIGEAEMRSTEPSAPSQGDALELWEKAVKHMDKGEWQEARQALEGVLAIEPDHPGSLNKLGVCLVESGDTSGAEAMFRRALEVDPQMAQAHSNLGNIELTRGCAAAARDLYLEALKLDPNYSLAHHNLSAAYKRLGQIDKAIAEHKKARSLESQHGRSAGYAAPDQSRPARSRLGCVFWLVILGIMIAIIMTLR